MWGRPSYSENEAKHVFSMQARATAACIRGIDNGYSAGSVVHHVTAFYVHAHVHPLQCEEIHALHMAKSIIVLATVKSVLKCVVSIDMTYCVIETTLTAPASPCTLPTHLGEYVDNSI